MSIVKKIRKHSFNKQDPEFNSNLLELIDHASQLSSDESFLQAGLIFQDCKYLSWGYDDKILFDCTHKGILNLDKAANILPTDSYEAILALHNLNSLISDFYFMLSDNVGLREVQIKAKEELAFRLIKFSKNEHKGHFLVNGFQISYNLVDKLECIFPNYPISGNQRSYSDERIVYHIPSAFDVLKDIQDFAGCIEIAEDNEELFSAPSQKGWYNAALGWTKPEQASKYFWIAQEEFAKDTHENYEKQEERKGGWSSINVDLWSPYYLSLYYLSKSIEEPEKGKEWIIKAAEVFAERGGRYLDPTVVRYELIIKAISQCLQDSINFDVDAIIKEYKRNIKMTGTFESDEHVISFISGLRETLIGFHENPQDEIKKGRLLQLADQLNRISILEETQSKTIDNVISNEALVLCQGPTSWIYRKLESITDEDLLRKILLRLFQTLSPIYAQNIHGIVEHGRDILVLKETNGKLLLELYQVKVGDVKTAEWRVIKPQLEEMMEVTPPDSLELNDKEYDKIGFLAFNGHIQPIVDSKVAGWKEDRFTKLDEKYEVMHLDKMVNFIFSNRLVSEFRETLHEFNI